MTVTSLKQILTKLRKNFPAALVQHITALNIHYIVMNILQPWLMRDFVEEVNHLVIG
jgi:hypothetical protein